MPNISEKYDDKYREKVDNAIIDYVKTTENDGAKIDEIIKALKPDFPDLNYAYTYFRLKRLERHNLVVGKKANGELTFYHVFDGIKKKEPVKNEPEPDIDDAPIGG